MNKVSSIIKDLNPFSNKKVDNSDVVDFKEITGKGIEYKERCDIAHKMYEPIGYTRKHGVLTAHNGNCFYNE